jgi:hypothetical protein
MSAATLPSHPSPLPAAGVDRLRRQDIRRRLELAHLHLGDGVAERQADAALAVRREGGIAQMRLCVE